MTFCLSIAIRPWVLRLICSAILADFCQIFSALGSIASTMAVAIHLVCPEGPLLVSLLQLAASRMASDHSIAA